jgi:uncharacterized protein YbbC (DUF1343 family)/CubicO group peptidase (beta-lactamase class C family)
MKDESRPNIKTYQQNQLPISLAARFSSLLFAIVVSSCILHLSSFAAAADGWSAVDTEVNAAVDRGELPGAVIAVLHDNQVVYRKAFGLRAKRPATEPMTVDTVFDLASLTKPVATATSVWTLIEAGNLQLHEKVVAYWPEFGPKGKNPLTLAHLLLHTSGLIADNPVADYADGPAKAMERICALKPLAAPGERFMYSDVNYIVLGQLVQRVTGKSLDVYAKGTIFDPLGMGETGFRPAPALRARIAPTEQREGQWMRGDVHDPRAHLLGGIAGHAGLFSTADDLLIYARMILAGGSLNGKQILRPETVAAMIAPQSVPNGQRAYGWDVRTEYSSNRGEHFGGFGHTGFTGTSLWIDPASNTAVVFLSNAVHPDGKGKVKALRGRVATLAAEILQISKAHPLQRVGFDGVSTGIDVLKRENFARIRGKRIGLVTNHTGRDRTGAATVDLLHKADGLTLVALFGPEHGIRGGLDENVKDGKDEATGLPVYSLYGPRRKPTPELLKGIDTIVYDIQDIGCRFYTYISTLGNVMEACAENKIRLVILDRPNPIGGLAVEGPLADSGRSSFVAYHTIPIRHGLTVGELARMFQAERNLSLDLDVVKCEGWKRADYFDGTLLPWVNPSPNMRSLTQAILYPGIGLLETTNISVGRGTDTPFEWIGAPWIDGRRVATELMKHDLPGLSCVPTSRTPTASVHANKPCGGVQIFVTDRAKVEPVRLGLTLMDVLRTLHPNDWDPQRLDTLLIHKSTFDRVMANQPVAPLAAEWSVQAGAFHERRRPFLLYE